MYNLCIGMKVINITQLPGGSLSHKNKAIDLAGSDAGIDYWFSQGRWKCIGAWGTAGTNFFTAVDQNGNYTKVHCADGHDRYVTIALTHSNRKYAKTMVGRIYTDGMPMYEEGTNGNATGNHIHCEVAEGIQTTKIRNRSLGYYIFHNSKYFYWTMENELNPLAVFFINDSFSRVKSTKGAELRHCDSVTYERGAKDMKLHIHTFTSQSIRKEPTTKSARVGVIPALNSEAVVTGISPKMSDGWQYYKVNYQGIEGWCQYDNTCFEVLEGE